MKPWIAILFTLCLLAVILLASFLIPFGGWLITLSTALWAAIDSKKLQLKHYKSGISYGPTALFFGIALLWVVGFPWYLVMRYKIKTGTAVLKEASASCHVKT